jgi:hypothetical protein
MLFAQGRRGEDIAKDGTWIVECGTSRNERHLLFNDFRFCTAGLEFNPKLATCNLKLKKGVT